MSVTLGRVDIRQDGLVLPLNGYAATTTLTQNDYTAIFDATTGNLIANLPSSVASPGRVYIIKKGDATANTVTIDAFGADTIDGAGTLVLTAANQRSKIQSDGNGVWHVID